VPPRTTARRHPRRRYGRGGRRADRGTPDEPERFAAIFDRHAPAIHRYVARRLGRDAADDVTAETFLTAFRIRARFNADRAGVRPWLHGIAAMQIGRHRREEVRALAFGQRHGCHPMLVRTPRRTWPDTHQHLLER
jgi:DNA-directed RNA polymerase specialized sigma24 family protein